MLLQEVTKAAVRRVCGGAFTLVHTIPECDINQAITSVTSFYTVGLDLGLYMKEDVAQYSEVTENEHGADDEDGA